MGIPLLLVVTGMPSSGKTTVAEALARELELPLVAKDELKECLYETVGAADVAGSDRLGRTAYALIFALARTMLESGVSLIVEANFFRGQEPAFRDLPPHRPLQVHCDASLDVLLERYAHRRRHAGHHDAEKIEALPGRYESGAHSALDLAGEVVELDTTRGVDVDALVEVVRARLWPSA